MAKKKVIKKITKKKTPQKKNKSGIKTKKSINKKKKTSSPNTFELIHKDNANQLTALITKNMIKI